MICGRERSAGRGHFRQVLPRVKQTFIMWCLSKYLQPTDGGIPVAPPRVDSSTGPNRVNRAYWPTKENMHFFDIFFFDFFGLWKKWPQMAPNRAGRIFFLLIQTLPTFWAERIWILRIFIFVDFVDPKFRDFQVPRFPDAAADGRTLRSQPDPSPNAHRDQIRRKGPCCDFCHALFFSVRMSFGLEWHQFGWAYVERYWYMSWLVTRIFKK